MMKNMANSLLLHERIITTPAKAKVVKPFVEKLITLAKVDNQATRRQAFAQLRDKQTTTKLFETIGPRFKARPGGYCRILHLSKNRLGDNGERVVFELVERSPKEEAATNA